MLKKDSETQALDELFRELKSEWRTMWRERFDDKVVAEGVAVEDYSLLSLGRGTVVVATRNYRVPDFREIVEEQRKAGHRENLRVWESFCGRMGQVRQSSFHQSVSA